MSHSDTYDYQRLILPPSLVTRIDMARLISEVEQLDADMTAEAARTKVGAASGARPVLSDQLTDFLTVNQVDVESAEQRRQAIAGLRQLKDEAPVVHMTFATTADQASLSKLADWLRRSVHPQSLMVVGLQPNLIGGVYVRTTNQVHDLSVRAKLANSRHLLVEAVEELSGRS